MTTIPIEAGIPIPPARRGHRKPNETYPFMKLQIGESFLVRYSGDRRVIAALCSYYGKKRGRGFITRSVEDGLRVWRVK